MTLILPPALIPSKLELVNEALAALKQPAVTSLANQKPLITLLANSVDDCVNDIYSRAEWRFRLRTWPIELTAEEQFYSIPPDFGTIYGRGITANNLFIAYMDDNEFSKASITPYGNVEDQSGVPFGFTLWDFAAFKFYPKPSATFIASYPILQLQYYCSAQPIVSEDESPVLPYAFKLCVVNFLKYRWMASNEYGVTDMQEAKGMYEGQLNLLLMRNDPQPHGHAMRSGFKINGGHASPNKFDPFGGW